MRAFVSLSLICLGSTLLPACAANAGAPDHEEPGHTEAAGARSISITIVNQSEHPLIATQNRAGHGEFAEAPPAIISVNGQASFGAESSGVATGVEVTLGYRLDGAAGSVSIGADNPFAGSNSYRCDTAGDIVCSWAGGSGNDAAITFTIARLSE